MSLSTPTTKDISANINAQLESALNQSLSLLPKAFTRVLSKVLGGVFILIYKFAGSILLQQFVATASDRVTVVNGVEIIPLVEWGRLVGAGDPKAATQADLVIDIIVDTQVGSLPSGTQLVSTDNGVTYLTIGAVNLDAPTVQATIRASSDQAGGGGAGEIGNLADGATVSFANPLANVNRNATVSSTAVTGADGEATETYRQRIIDTFQARPQGGAYADYRIWGVEPEGIKQVYPYTGDPGTVRVYVESDTTEDGIPTQDQLDAVEASIEFDENGLATRRPVSALTETLAIIRTEWETKISGVSIPAGAQSQAESDITEAVQDYFLNRDPFIVGLDTPPRLDIITKSGVIGVVEDVVTSFNGTFSDVTIEKTDNPGITIEIDTLDNGEKAKSLVTFL